MDPGVRHRSDLMGQWGASESYRQGSPSLWELGGDLIGLPDGVSTPLSSDTSQDKSPMNCGAVVAFAFNPGT